ncbi:MAG TPA: phosphatase PAP2 family protein [Patescibacteria group bacterium]
MLLIILIVITFFIINSVTFTRIDNAFAVFLFSARTPFLAHVFYIITSFANQATIISLLAITLCYLYFKKEISFAYALIFIIAGTEITLQLMKLFINRPRPTANIAYYIEKSSSFPSGHSATAVAFFGFVAYYLARNTNSKNKKVFVTIFTILFVLLIGFSRLYLDVHFLSDVIAGFAMGGLWLIVGIAFHEQHFYAASLTKRKALGEKM